MPMRQGPRILSPHAFLTWLYERSDILVSSKFMSHETEHDRSRNFSLDT